MRRHWERGPHALVGRGSRSKGVTNRSCGAGQPVGPLRPSPGSRGLRPAAVPRELFGDLRIDCRCLRHIRFAVGSIALLHFRDPAAIEGLGPIGSQPQRRIIIGDREVVPGAVAVGDGAAVERELELGIETQRRPA
jgi:hypothetical protein